MIDHDNADIPEPGDQGELASLEARLEQERPVPAAGFRGELRKRLLAQEVTPLPDRRVRVLVAAYAVCGSLLLAVAALGTAGAGPLAAS